MKYLVCFLLILGGTDPATISRINAVKAEAKAAYTKGDFKKAAADYKYLIDSMGVNEDEVKLNLANALFQLHDSTAAVHYNELTASPEANIRSRSNLQLGVMEDRNKHLEEALNHFKASLMADPHNDMARYNYEMVKKKLDEQKKQQNQNQQNQKDQNQKDQQQKQQQQKQQDQKSSDKNQQQQQNKDQQKQDSQNAQQKDQQKQQDQAEEQKKNGEDQKEADKRDLAEKLKQMNMSEEKAKMILEAMKNQEIQYLQQNTHKSKTPRDSGKPDW